MRIDMYLMAFDRVCMLHACLDMHNNGTSEVCRFDTQVYVSCARGRYRFSAFWLRSKCSICSYQLNI